MDILGLGHALGDAVGIDSVRHPKELQIAAIRNSGYEHYWVSEDTARALGGRAARAAIDDAGYEPDALRFVVAGQSNVPDYVGIDFACQIGAELGGLTLKTANIVEGCASAISTWFTAERLGADLRLGEIGVIVLAQRVSEPHQDRFGLMNAVLSDGAVAIVVGPEESCSKSQVRFRYVGGEEISNSRFVDMMRLERGGGVDPYVMPTHDSRRDRLGRERIADLYQFETDDLMAFLDLRMQTTLDVIERALGDAGWHGRDRLVLVHALEGGATTRLIGKKLGIPIERTNDYLTARIGHMGCVDPALSLELMVQEGRIKPGDHIIQSTISTGMKWACCLLECLPGAHCPAAPELDDGDGSL